DSPEVAAPAIKALTERSFQLQQGDLGEPRIWVIASVITDYYTQELYDRVQDLVEPAGTVMQVGVTSNAEIADWILFKARLPPERFVLPFGEHDEKHVSLSEE